jgi:hypothetical protein
MSRRFMAVQTEKSIRSVMSRHFIAVQKEKTKPMCNEKTLHGSSSGIIEGEV